MRKSQTYRNSIPGVISGVMLLIFFAPLTFAVEPQAEIQPDIKAIEPVPEGVYIWPGYRGFDVEIWTDRRTYYIGDSIRVYFRTNHDAYVYIYNTDPAGVTRLLFPNYYDHDNFVRAYQTYVIPDYRYDLRITGPAGREYLHIVAVRSRVYILERFYKFSPAEPFPRVKEGPKELIRELQKLKQESQIKQLRPEAKKQPPRGETELRRIEPVPHPHPPYAYDYAEDTTSFYVRWGYGRPYDYEWYPPSWYDRDYWFERGYGSLVLRSSPERARIYIDGDYKGRTPKTVSLPAGWHRLRITKDGYADWVEQIHISAGERQYIYADLERVGFEFRRSPREKEKKKLEKPEGLPQPEKKRLLKVTPTPLSM